MNLSLSLSFPAPGAVMTAPSLPRPFFLGRATTKSLKAVHWFRSVNALGKMTPRPLPMGLVTPSAETPSMMPWPPAPLASLPDSLTDVVPVGEQGRRASSLFRQSEMRNVHCPLTSSASHAGSPSVQTTLGEGMVPAREVLNLNSPKQSRCDLPPPGMHVVALAPRQSSATFVQSLVMVPSARITKLSRSVTSTCCELMTSNWTGNRRRASVAGPPSPAKPRRPVPATV